MKHVKTTEEFQKLWESNDRLVVKFTAEWCGPCKMIAPTLEKLEKANPDVTFIEVDIDKFNTLTDMMGIRSVPTIYFVSRGVIVKQCVGAVGEETLKKGLRMMATLAKAE